MIGRRKLLRGLGGVALGLPFLNLMAPTGAAAVAPKRFITMFTPQGFLPDLWANQSGSGFSLLPLMDALGPHAADLTIIRGMSFVPSSESGHDVGASVFTGHSNHVSGGDVGLPKGMSVGQAIANHIGNDTRFKSLEFGVQTDSSKAHRSNVVYAGDNQPIPSENNPSRMFDRVFSDLNLDTSEIDALRRRRESILDRVHGDFDDVSRVAGAEDRVRLEAHQDNIRSIETRLLDVGATAACSPPLVVSLAHLDNDNYPAVARLQIDLMVQALACDQTRVANLQFSPAGGGPVFRWLPGVPNKNHHDIAHDSDENAADQSHLQKAETWFIEQFAYLIESLKAIPEDTGTLFDSTAILWGTELPRGSHDRGDGAFVLAGSAGGTFQLGKYIDGGARGWAGSHSNSGPSERLPLSQRTDYVGALMLAVAQGFGVEATVFGDPEYCQNGPLMGLV